MSKKISEISTNQVSKRGRGRPTTPEAHAEAEDRRRERTREQARRQHAAVSEIGDLPPVANPERKRKAEESLLYFLQEYFKSTFYLEWGKPQLICVDRIERVIKGQGCFALALPRGSGKTQIASRAALWAVLTGRKKFVLLVGANEEAANELLETIKVELEFNEELNASFPAATIPFRKLEGQSKRATAQTYHGAFTRQECTSGKLTLATIEGAPSSGACVRSVGILSRIRGMSHLSIEGKPLRPSLVICDDVQTDESAASQEGTNKRLAILNSTILQLAGPGVPMSVVSPCTVISENDLSSRLLDPQQSPGWVGERWPLLASMPSKAAMEIWQTTYKELWEKSLREHGNVSLATEFYRQHRAEMDEGAIENWPARHDPDELSSTQNAINLYLRSKEAFMAEMQQDPIKNEIDEKGNLTEAHVAAKIIGKPFGWIPQYAEHLIVGIDVQHECLCYSVLAVDEAMNCHLSVYGAWPKQSKVYYTIHDLNPGLETFYPGMALEARIFKALEDLTHDLCGRHWEREDKVPIEIDGVMVDTGEGRLSTVIYQWARETDLNCKVLCYKGMGIGPSKKAISSYRRSPGERIGEEWLIKPMQKHGRQKICLADAWYWASVWRDRLLTPRGERGCMTISGDPLTSKLILDSFTSEYGRTIIGDRVVEQWFQRPTRSNNHWADATRMALVMASTFGCRILDPQKPTPTPVRKHSPQVISATRERRDGVSNNPIPYAPKPVQTRPARQSFSGTISVKR